jgi:hypothetical protein
MAKELGLKRRLINLDNFLQDNGRPRKINSPRSLEACLRQGIDPSELIPLTLDVFIEEEQELTGVRDVAVTKYEHYEERRNEKLELAMHERNMIIGFLEEAQRTGKVSPQAKKFMKLAGANTEKKGLSDAEKIALAEAEKSKSSMLEEEKRRVIAMKKRQQKEIEQMMEFEMAVAKMQAEQLRLQEIDAEKQKKRKKEREMKKKAAIERRRQMDLARAEREREEEESQAEQARQDYIFEQRRKKMQLQQDREAKKAAQAAEAARIKAKMDRAAQLKTIQDAQQSEIQKKLQQMRVAEKRRKERRAKENAQRLAESKAKKLEAMERIKKAIEANERLEYLKREDFWAKQDREKIRQAERLSQTEKMNEAKKKRILEGNRKRQQSMEEARRIDRMNAKKINDERIAREEMVARNAAGRYSADMVKKTKEELRKKDKLENIERMRRIDEFVRLQTLQKIALDEERTISLKKQKAKLLLQRKEQATKQRVTKARLGRAIEGLRKTQKWDQMDKIIDSAVSGKTKKKKRRRKSGSRSMPALRGQP